MTDYVLKLYRTKDPSSTVMEGMGQFPFKAEEDAAAVAHARAEYGEQIDQYDHVILWADGNRFVHQFKNSKSPRNA